MSLPRQMGFGLLYVIPLVIYGGWWGLAVGVAIILLLAYAYPDKEADAVEQVERRRADRLIEDLGDGQCSACGRPFLEEADLEVVPDRPTPSDDEAVAIFVEHLADSYGFEKVRAAVTRVEAERVAK